MPVLHPAYLRLYKHALESIFSHLNLAELGRISATCRDWSAAVDSMRPIGAQTRNGTLELRSMCTSRLMRHVSGLRLIKVSDLANFCDVIKQNKSLTKVDLSNNQIGDVGASAIQQRPSSRASRHRPTWI